MQSRKPFGLAHIEAGGDEGVVVASKRDAGQSGGTGQGGEGAKGKEADPKSPKLGAQASLSMSPRFRNKWKAAMGDGDSSDDDLDHGPSAPPRRAASVIRGKNTPSLRGQAGTSGSGRAPRTPQTGGAGSIAPGSKRLDAQHSATMSPRSPCSPIGAVGENGDKRPALPPFLDLGEPSVAPTPRTRVRGNAVEFASSPESQSSPEMAKVARKDALDPQIGQSPPASTSGNSRGHSNDENDHDAHGDDSDAATPLTAASNPPVNGKSAAGLSRYGDLERDKSPRQAPGSPRSPVAAFQALIRRASRSGTSPQVPATSNPASPSAPPKEESGGGSGARSIRSITMPSPYLPARTAATFEDLYNGLEADEKSFFDFLDSELEKVESFYLAREAEAMHRGEELRAQLRELAEHRRIYHSLYGEGNAARWEGKVERMLPNVIGSEATQATVSGVASAAQKLHLRIPGRVGYSVSAPPTVRGASAGDAIEHAAGATGPDGGAQDQSAKLREAMRVDKEHKTYSPERYTKYKSELRKAVLEYYRSLEIIKNYRVRYPSHVILEQRR